MRIEQRLDDLGLELPAQTQVPAGVSIPFEWVRIHGDRAVVAGHGALHPDGRPAGPFGRVPTEVPLDAAQQSARLAALAMLASLQHVLGDLDRITAWLNVSGFVQADPGYAQTTLVVNPCSDLLLSVFGPDVGRHARTAIGVAALPLRLPVIVAGEVAIAP